MTTCCLKDDWNSLDPFPYFCRFSHVPPDKENAIVKTGKFNPPSSLSSHSSSSSTSLARVQQANGDRVPPPPHNNQSSLSSGSSTILRNRSSLKFKSQESRASRTIETDVWTNGDFEFLPIAERRTDSEEVNNPPRHQPWESPSYKLGVPLNEFRPAYNYFDGCDGSDDAINSSMSMASECSLNTTSSSLEEHVLQLLEDYQPDGNGSVRSACENPVARILMSNSGFSDDIPMDCILVSSPRRNSSPAGVGSRLPGSVQHRPAAMHAHASAPVLYFSPR